MSRRLPDKCRGAGSGLVRSLPRAAASELLPRLLLCHADAPAPLGSRQRAPCCCPPPVGWGRVAQLCNGFGPPPPLMLNPAFWRLTSPTSAPAPVTRTRLHRSDRANVHRAAAPIGWAGAEPPYLCNGFGLRRRSPVGTNTSVRWQSANKRFPDLNKVRNMRGNWFLGHGHSNR